MCASQLQSPRALIIGAGCTGALTAALLRHQWDTRNPKDKGCSLHISVWEWGRGPAGRMSTFWKDINGERVVADVGAQVASLRDDELVPPWLKPHLTPADPKGLGSTTERKIPGWSHFHAPAGLTSLQWASLKEARVDDCRFESRVTEMTQLPGDIFPRWRIGFGGSGKSRGPAGSAEFDVVVFAGTATDALGLEGLKNALSLAQQVALKGVRYDHRIALTLLLQAEFLKKLESLCKGQAELSVEGTGKIGSLSLVARQEVKGRSHKKACALTLHSTPQFAAQNLQVAKQAEQHPKDRGSLAMRGQLADMLGIPLQALDAAVIDSKVVHWRQCQVIQPLRARGATPRGCMIASTAPSLVVAGDYLADADIAGSFEGCLESAIAAARAACDALLGSSSALQTSKCEEYSGPYPGSSTIRMSPLESRSGARGCNSKGRWHGSVVSSSPTKSEEHVSLQRTDNVAGESGDTRVPRRWQRKKQDSENVHGERVQ